MLAGFGHKLTDNACGKNMIHWNILLKSDSGIIKLQMFLTQIIHVSQNYEPKQVCYLYIR